jgi:hypothetical protein
MLASAVSCAVCVCIWLYLHFIADGKPQQPQIRQAIATGGGDNTGSQFHAGGDLHYHEAPPQQAPIAPAASLPPDIPYLELSFATAFVKFDDDTYPRFDEGGKKAIVMRVRNKPGSRGEVAPHATDIFAQLDFDCSIGKSTVDRAYWIDREGNRITLSGGDDAWILVGGAEPSFLCSWHNPNTYPSSMRDWNSPTCPPEDRTIPWGNGQLRGQVYIIAQSPRGNRTLAHRQFVFTRERWTNDFGNINIRFIE